MSDRRLALKSVLSVPFLLLLSPAAPFLSWAGPSLDKAVGNDRDEIAPKPVLKPSTRTGRVVQAPDAETFAPPPPPPVPPTPVEHGKPKREKPPLDAERPKSEKPLEALLLERGAILLPQGALQIEPSLGYTHYSSERVAVSGLTVFEAIAIGRVSVDRLSRDLYTAAVTARYGLLDRLQIDMRVPYVNRQDRETIGTGLPGAIEHNTHGSDIGDIEASLAGQALRGQEAIPGVILRLRGRFPTGTHAFEIPTEVIAGNTRLKDAPTGNGYYSVAPGFTLAWRSEPVVFFSGANYSFNLERTFGTRGTVNAGDTVDLFLGLTMAVSERVGVNLSFLDAITASTKVNGAQQAGTSFNDGRLILGTSIAVSPTSTVSVSAGAGLTRESPDFTLTLSLPITLKVF